MGYEVRAWSFQARYRARIVAALRLWVDDLLLFRARGLDRGDVDLPHRHHCVHRTLGCSAIRVRRRRQQRARSDLP